MASPKLAKTEKSLQTTRKTLRNVREQYKTTSVVSSVLNVATAPLGGAVAAEIDARQPEDPTAGAGRMGPLPTNMVVGGLIAVGGIFVPQKARIFGSILEGTGGGMMAAASYRARLLRAMAARAKARGEDFAPGIHDEGE